MAFSSCFCHSQFSPKTGHTRQAIKPRCSYRKDQIFSFSLKSMSTKLFGQRVAGLGTDLNIGWSFVGGSRVIMTPKFALLVRYRRGCGVYASWLASSQIASSAFMLGTVAVLPFYTLMVLAPKAELEIICTLRYVPVGMYDLFGSVKMQTKKSIKSTIPYVVLGLLYAYLLFRSWTPNTIQLMFASKYWLPELPGIAKMFSSEMTLASAWIHLLAVDLFAARQIFHDGLENLIETRHSVSLCLLFCPIGIMIHFITKMLTKSDNSTSQRAGSDLCV